MKAIKKSVYRYLLWDVVENCSYDIIQWKQLKQVNMLSKASQHCQSRKTPYTVHSLRSRYVPVQQTLHHVCSVFNLITSSKTLSHNTSHFIAS